MMALQAPAKASKMPLAEVSRDTPAMAKRVYVIPRRCNGNATAAGVEFPDHTEGVRLNAGEIFDPNAHALEETNAQLRHFAHALRHDLEELLRMVVNEGEPGEEANKCNTYSMDGALRIEALLKALLTYLEITAKRNAEAWLCPVRDNGIGIAPQHADWAFGTFERRHGEEIPGTGIGLGLCKRVVERRRKSRS